MRCFAPIQAVITFSLADLFLDLKTLYYRHSEVQNMGGVKMTFHKITKSHFYGTAYKLLNDVIKNQFLIILLPRHFFGFSNVMNFIFFVFGFRQEGIKG